MLRGTVNGNGMHFVSWIRYGSKWILYDGIPKPPTFAAIEEEELRKQWCERYWVQGTFYEVIGDEEETARSIGIPDHAGKTGNEEEEEVEQLKALESKITTDEIKRSLVDEFSRGSGTSKKREDIRKLKRKSNRVRIGFTYMEQAKSPTGKGPKCAACSREIKNQKARFIHRFREQERCIQQHKLSVTICGVLRLWIKST